MGATLVNANDGDRSSLVTMDFYLSPAVAVEQLQGTQDIIWEAIQASGSPKPKRSVSVHK